MVTAPGILVVGRHGQLAEELCRALSAGGYPFTALGRAEMDLGDVAAVDRVVASIRPSLVVNAAAYTAVDKAEDEPAAAHAINAVGAGRLAAAAHEFGAPIVHISTDYVFDGSKESPYVETDATNPLGVYGASKLEGERLVAASNPRHVILRTAWVFSPHGNNFVKTVLRLGGEREEIAVVADQTGTPTSAADLAGAIVTVADRIGIAAVSAEQFGVYHAVGTGATTWHGFATAVMNGARARGAKGARVNAIATTDYPTRARRPANSVLNASKLSRAYGITLPDWQTSLDRCLDSLIGPAQ